MTGHITFGESVIRFPEARTALVREGGYADRSKSSTPQPKRCGHCLREFWGAVHDCFPAEDLSEPSDVSGRL